MILDFNYNKYKNKPGIYKITNTITNKSYIGQSIDLGRRLYAHILLMRKGTGTQVIYKAVKKYGMENFNIEILTVFPEHENLHKNLDLAEKIYIQFYDTYNNGYNSTIGGDGGILGYKMSDEEKKKRSLAQKGKSKDRLQINSKSKKVYMYNYVHGYYISASSTSDASDLCRLRGYKVSCGNIQDCARGLHKRTHDFVCSYSKEELFSKIEKLNQEQNDSKF